MPRTPVVRRSLTATIIELQRQINRFESEQGRTTRSMVEAVQAGEQETAEIGEWLTICRRLDELMRHRVPKPAVTSTVAMGKPTAVITGPSPEYRWHSHSPNN